MPVEFEANGRRYAPPDQSITVICVEGCADEYLSVSISRGRMPNMERMAREGYRGLARGVVPSFTNVNNTSIVTGVPPAINGIAGNFFLNLETGEEVMMNSAEYRRCGTLLTAAADAGRSFVIYPGKVTGIDSFRIGTIGHVFPEDIDRLITAIEASMYWE